MYRSLCVALVAIAFSATLFGQQPNDRRTLGNLLEDGQQTPDADDAPTRERPSIKTSTTDSAKLSPAVKKILDKAVAGIKANRQAFDKANEKPLAEAKEELQALAKQLIEDGKTEEATVVLKQISTLEADVMRGADSTVSASTGRAVATKPFLERIAGKWTHPNSTVVRVFGSGGYTELDKKDGRRTSTGTVTLKGRDTALVKTISGYTMEVRITEDGETMSCLLWDASGKESGTGMVLRKTQ